MIVSPKILKDSKWQKLSSSERLVLFALLIRGNRGMTWPSIKTISTDTGLSKRTVCRILNSLSEKKAVNRKTVVQYKNGIEKKNFYNLMVWNEYTRKRAM